MSLRSADGREAKVSGLFRVMGQETTKREAAREGETVALGKVEAARTGDTLSTGMVADLAPLPDSMPMMSLAIAPRERKDDVRLSSALQRILEEDPSLRLIHVPETGETVLEGHGEMHLRVVHRAAHQPLRRAGHARRRRASPTAKPSARRRTCAAGTRSSRAGMASSATWC